MSKEIRRLLVTGNLGYIGSVLVPILVDRGYEVRGLDAGYYADDTLTAVSDPVVSQIRKDVRDVIAEDVEGVDGIIHLAALCNDPLGDLDPNLTDQINFQGTVRLAEVAKEAGVSRFVYSSSQSMYGVAGEGGELDEDADKNPITAYARTKWAAEQALSKLSGGDFLAVSFRPSTVFGASPRLRSDIVFNNFVGSAYTRNQIRIMSDGTPWRPVVHVRDVSSAYVAGLEAPAELVAGRSFNVGIPDGNYTVRQLAEAAQRAVPGSELTFTGEHGSDSRTYKVSFKRILSELSDYFRPEWDLDKGAAELLDLYRDTDFTEADFTGPKTNRLRRINSLLEAGRIGSDLRWIEE
jgi:nucleoside-diphosphate-sugar epimerase